MPSTSAPSDPVSVAGVFYDGLTAVRHRVTVVMADGALLIQDDRGWTLESWPYADIAFADRTSAGVRLSRAVSEARLLLEDERAYEAVRAKAPNLFTRQKRLRRGMISAVAATVAVVVGAYAATPYLTQMAVAMTPLAFEEDLGRSYAQSLAEVFSDADKPACSEAAGTQALDKIVAELTAQAQPKIAYKVRVLDTRMVNAVALPGGYVFLFRGLLDEARTQDEVVGVLAHEMAHVDMRHPMHGLVRSYGISILTDLMFGGSMMGGVSNLAMMSSYSRDAERDADEAAFRTLQGVGVSASGLADFFERLQHKEEDSFLQLPGFVSTHPQSKAREDRARHSFQGERHLLSEQEWEDLRAICKK